MKSAYQLDFDDKSTASRPRTANRNTTPRHPKIVYAQELREEREQGLTSGLRTKSVANLNSRNDALQPASGPASSFCEHNDEYLQENARDLILGMKTEKFLHTNMTDYLKKGSKNQTCISCLKCMQKRRDNVSYKYQSKLQTNYMGTFQRPTSAKQPVFILDQERRQVRVPFDPPKSFVTAYKEQFADARGSN